MTAIVHGLEGEYGERVGATIENATKPENAERIRSEFGFTASFCIIDDMVVSVSLDLRLASSRLAATQIGGQLDPQFEMASNLRNRDAYITIVDMLGHGQPGAYHLLKEGGSGFITFENGNRILIL